MRSVKKVVDVGEIRSHPKVAEICASNDIEYLGVFGSFARGEAKPRSDIDLLVRFATRKSLLDLVRLEREFSKALGRRVDLLTEAAISPYLVDRVKAQLKVVYEKPG